MDNFKEQIKMKCIFWKLSGNLMKKLSFEASIQELEEIVAKLENGEESLEESLKLFEKGTKLASSCYQTLEKAEQKTKHPSAGTGGESEKSRRMFPAAFQHFRTAGGTPGDQ